VPSLTLYIPERHAETVRRFRIALRGSLSEWLMRHVLNEQQPEECTHTFATVCLDCGKPLAEWNRELAEADWRRERTERTATK